MPDRDPAAPDQDPSGTGPERTNAGPEPEGPGPERRARGRQRQARDRAGQTRDRQAQARDRQNQARDSQVQAQAEARDRQAQAHDRNQQAQAEARDRQAQAHDRNRPSYGADRAGPQDDVADADDLWPPYLSPFNQEHSDRDSRAHRMLHERAERDASRGPRGRGRNRLVPSLSRGEIVETAIGIADAEGPDAVSMRRIAQVLKAGTMSLYWHVVNKEQLLDLMLDAVLAQVEVPEPSGDWRADLRALARNQRATHLRHAWVMDFIGGRPTLGPSTLLHLDRALALLDDLDLDLATAVDILGLVQTYVMGAAIREMRETRIQRDQEQSGVSLEDWEPARQVWRDKLAADGRFSHVVRFLDEGIDPDAAETRDERFEFGLACVLDGIAARVGAGKSANG